MSRAKDNVLSRSVCAIFQKGGYMAAVASIFRQVAITLVVAALIQTGASSAAVSNNSTRVDALRVSMAFPQTAGRRVVHVGTQSDHFHVILENVSTNPIKLWRGLEYLGYASLSFRLTDQKGVAVVVRHAPLPPGSETDMSFVLNPGECFVIDIHPASPEWCGFPTPREESAMFSLQAVYTSEVPKRDAIGWTGQTISPVYDVVWFRSIGDR